MSDSRHFSRLLLSCILAVIFGLPAGAEPYRITVGDTLSLSIFAQPELSGAHVVGDEGAIKLHLIGEVHVAGMTLTEASDAVAAAAERAFEAPASVIAEMASYREIYVLGDVARPDAYPFSPGLTVVQALALAGDMRWGVLSDTDTGRRVFEERRRMLLAQARKSEAEASIMAIDAELQRLDAGGAPPSPTDESLDANAHLDQQNALIGARREVMTRAVDGAARQQSLAAEEARLLSQRNTLVARQIELTEQNLRDVDTLVERGLARRERQLDLAVRVDNYRADSLEIAAFEARAHQTAANAGSAAAVAVSRYREQLMSDRIGAIRALEAAVIEFSTSREFLQVYGDAGAAVPSIEPLRAHFEIIRGGATLEAEQGAALRPGDVLRATLVPADAQ